MSTLPCKGALSPQLSENVCIQNEIWVRPPPPPRSPGQLSEGQLAYAPPEACGKWRGILLWTLSLGFRDLSWPAQAPYPILPTPEPEP